MRTLDECIEHPGIRSRVVPAERAVEVVEDGMTLAVSGFTKSAEPKVFLPALARRFERSDPDAKITLFSGASLSEEVEGPLAPHIRRRAPYMSSRASRKLINHHEMTFHDVHLSVFARNLGYGFYGDIDVAVVEASRVRPDGSVVLSSAVGISPEALTRAKKIVLEVNRSQPDYTGFHDITLPPAPPTVGWPIPITGVTNRVGTPYVNIDPDKVVAVVESTQPDYGVSFKPTSAVHTAIARQIIAFLVQCRDQLGWRHWCPPMQSGVGNVANAVVAELHRSPFSQIRFYTEVFQDGMLEFVADRDKFAGASATGLSFSTEGASRFYELFERCRETVVLRPMWLSNSPEIITRLFVVSMNTPVEFDIRGQVNSTQVRGQRIINGLGGSGDFFRNAYISIAHSPSVRKLSDGRTVSCVVPRVGHTDHTEHDLRCYVTERGYVVDMDINDRARRADAIIERCAHPHFRPLLRDYVRIVGDDDPNDHLEQLEGWSQAYDAACVDFPE